MELVKLRVRFTKGSFLKRLLLERPFAGLVSSAITSVYLWMINRPDFHTAQPFESLRVTLLTTHNSQLTTQRRNKDEATTAQQTHHWPSISVKICFRPHCELCWSTTQKTDIQLSEKTFNSSNYGRFNRQYRSIKHERLEFNPRHKNLNYIRLRLLKKKGWNAN